MDDVHDEQNDYPDKSELAPSIFTPQTTGVPSVPTGSSDSPAVPGTTSSAVSPPGNPTPELTTALSRVTTTPTSFTLFSSSTHASSLSTLADSTPAATSSAASVTADNVDMVKGLIAGIAVFATLFLVMTGILIWTLRRRRTERHYVQPDPPLPAVSKDSLDPSLAGLESTIVSLENQLHEKDTQLRERQVSMIAKGQSISRTQTVKRVSMPDDQIRERFIELRTGVSQWVSTYFGASKFTATPIPDAVGVLKKTFPQYASLVKENGMVTVVLEGLVIDMISQSFASGQLLGNEAFWELKQAITSTVSASEANEWRAMTMRLLEKTPNYQSDRKEAVEDLSQMIDAACSELTKTRPKGERRSSLEQIVDSAASLALDVAKQRALFKIERPTISTFCPETMEAWDPSSEVEDGVPIRAIIFPAVTKCVGNSKSASVSDDGLVIVKARVLL